MSGDKQFLIDNEEEVDKNHPIDEKNEHEKRYEVGESSQSVQSQADLVKAKRLPQYIATVTATLSAFASGIVLGWTSPISKELENGTYHNITINENEMGWIGSFVTLGGMMMCFPYGIVCDLIGRRPALLLLIVPFSLGWSLIAWANSLLMLYIGRFITGMAAGAGCVAAPLYVNEIASKEIRGTLGSYFQLMVTIGVFFAYVVGKFTNIYQYTIICAMVPFIFFMLFVFQPETPLYSLKKGKVETARNSLVRLRGPNFNVDSEIEDIKTTLESSMRSTSSISESLKHKAARKAFIIALVLMFLQQLSGINAIIFYTSEIFAASGSKMDPKTAAIFVGAFQALATFVASLIIDKLGRRMLLISSDFVMGLATAFLGLFFTLKDRHLVSDDTLSMLGLLPVVSLCVFVIMFSMGLGPIPWIISGELFTPELKSFAASSAGTVNWFLAFIVTKFYLELEIKVGADVMFYVFSVISLCGSLFCYFVVPETKGKTIDQIQKELEG